MIGQSISHYKILEKLGEGGMGVVYKAHDTKLDRTVALKFLSADLTANPQTKSRFVQEARAASRLDHPNISVIHEIGDTDDGRSFICMGYYDGETLEERIERDPPDIETSVNIALQIAKGLQSAHKSGIVHRDIKPANIMLTSGAYVKIVDFGLAKLMSESGITETGRSVGTLAYMSPEQLQGKKIDAKTDLYSLGVLLYEMITGQRPFAEEHYAALMYSIVNVDPPPPSLINPSVPKELDEIVLQLIRKNPDQRYKSASAVVEKLNDYLSEKKVPLHKNRSGLIGFISQPKAIFAALLVVIIIAVLSFPDSRSSLPSFFNFTSAPDDIHLVVLPFLNVGEDPANQPFNDGLMEILTSSLTMLQPQDISYWVVSASDVRQQNVTSARDALREFNATIAVHGSLQRLSNRIQLTLNLVDTKTARQIKSDMLSVSVDSLPHLQDEAVNLLAQMLNIDDKESRFTSGSGSTTVARSYELYLEGRGYLQDYQMIENIERAINLFNRAIELDPEYAQAYAGLGEAYRRMYDETRDSEWVDMAIQYSERAKEINNELAAVHVTLGMIQQATGRYDEAVNSFRRALELDSVNSDAYRGLARAYVQLGSIDQAEETYKRSIRLRPTYWAGYNQLGGFYYGQGKFTEAVQQYEKVIELIPNSSYGYSNLGVVYYYLEDYPKAIELFNKASEIEPGYFIWSNLGTLHYYHESNFEEAAQMYENALNISDHDHRVWAHLASASYWSGRDSLAVKEYYQKALTLAKEEERVNPRDAELLVNIAGYQTALGDFSEARQNLTYALELAPENISVICNAGIVYEQLGDRDRALTLITNALERGYAYSEIENDPHLREFLRDPRFISFIQDFTTNSAE
ncbi:MAG: serine/threonine-protein kinase [Balneolaceae bacterium]|nr:MAG: serine/threonine-protein kinase [Balneolaceae bacterium]